MIVDLTQFKSGQTGKVVQIEGGSGLAERLERMGIRVGKEITKISAQLWRGPQTVKVGNSQIAIGFGMAKRVMVEIKK